MSGSHTPRDIYTVVPMLWLVFVLSFDRGFAARVAGHLYAQPLTWRMPGAGTILLTACAWLLVPASGASAAVPQATL